MTTRYLSLITLLASFLTGCGTMNSNFSCNVTAGDSCLTIEQVEAMTCFANDAKPKKLKLGKMKAEAKKPEGLLVHHKGQSLWVVENVKEQSWA